MNVTIKIDDQLCKEARHRAVDENLSLSGWIATLIAREVSAPTAKSGEEASPPRLLDLLGDADAAEVEFDTPRSLEFAEGAEFDAEVSA